MIAHQTKPRAQQPFAGDATVDELLTSYHFDLPSRLIAQQPCSRRDASRLLSCSRHDGSCNDQQFSQLADLLERGDLLVVNDTRVIQARLCARKEHSGGAVEILLIEALTDGSWSALVRPSSRVRPGTRVVLQRRGIDSVSAKPAPVLRVGEVRPDGSREIHSEGADLAELANFWGEMPLPPYIDRSGGPRSEDDERYQTIFARESGAVAAPTAGLHFSPAVLDSLRDRGIDVACVTLHVGPGTFTPVRNEQLSEHVMHSERYCVPADTAARIEQCETEGGRVVAVGTTACRSLESWHRLGRPSDGQWRTTDLFLRPGHGPSMNMALLTNFHLPGSTLLMLVAAFLGRETTLHLYGSAAEKGYRFYSYGDAMLIL